MPQVRRGVVREVEDGLTRAKARKPLAENVQAAADQVLRLGQRQLGLVGVVVAVRLDDVAAGLQLVPEAEVPDATPGGRGQDVELGPQTVLLVQFGGLEAGVAEAVVEAEGEVAHDRCLFIQNGLGLLSCVRFSY